MYYVPAFLEIYGGFAVVLVWTWWLRGRELQPGTRRTVALLPWVVGAAVLGGQVLAVASIAMQLEGSAQPARLLDIGRTGSLLAVTVGLVTALHATIRWHLERRE
jgi:hypothetical protein